MHGTIGPVAKDTGACFSSCADEKIHQVSDVSEFLYQSGACFARRQRVSTQDRLGYSLSSSAASNSHMRDTLQMHTSPTLDAARRYIPKYLELKILLQFRERVKKKHPTSASTNSVSCSWKESFEKEFDWRSLIGNSLNAGREALRPRKFVR